MNAVRPAEVNLLTGFLGSGKTTLLQKLLADPRMAGSAVLINEFGEVGLDHELLERIDDTVMLMKSGCLCCAVRGEVADSLLSLHSKRERGLIPWFDRVAIESTGLADPFPVLSTVRAHPVARSHFCVGRVLTTVDAVNFSEAIEHRAEAARQIAAADAIIITKTDLCSVEETHALETRLAALNPAARLLRGAQGVAEILLEDGDTRWSDAEFPAAGAHDHAGGLGAVSFSLRFEEPLDWTAFGVWLTMLLNRHGDRIFRVKGILNLRGETRPVAVHGVQRLVHPPVHMARWPSEDRASRLVFILEGLEPERVRDSLLAFNRLSNSAPQMDAAHG